jgi:ubiquinone/menaquinone biosynthesis C-methylase UbiE
MHNLLNTLHTKLVFGRRVQTLAKALSEMIPIGSRVLDIGCGDGQISARIMKGREEVSITGIDVLLRPERHIPVRQFDGSSIPFDNSSFDVVMFVDVLHHTKDPTALLTEATRVTKKYILLKDHFRTGFLGALTLRLMDWFGNVHHGVVLPYNYLSEAEWDQIYAGLALRPARTVRNLHLYPKPADLIFGRGLHFIVLLEKL